jgi:low affinity Fe/Cu permease
MAVWSLGLGEELGYAAISITPSFMLENFNYRLTMNMSMKLQSFLSGSDQTINNHLIGLSIQPSLCRNGNHT